MRTFHGVIRENSRVRDRDFRVFNGVKRDPTCRERDGESVYRDVNFLFKSRERLHMSNEINFFARAFGARSKSILVIYLIQRTVAA